MYRDNGAGGAGRYVQGDALVGRQVFVVAVEVRREAHRPGARQWVFLGHDGAHDGARRRRADKLKGNRRARYQAWDALGRHGGLDLQVFVVDQGDDRLPDADVGADLDMADRDHPGVGRPNLGIPEFDIGHFQVDPGAQQRRLLLRGGAFCLDHFLALVFEACLAEGGRSAQALEALHFLGHVIELGLRRGDGGLGLGDLGGAQFAGRPDAVAGEDGNHFALLHPVADSDLNLGDGAAGARRHDARLARHQAANHGHRLFQGFASHGVDTDRGGTGALGGGRGGRQHEQSRRDEGEGAQGGNEMARLVHGENLSHGSLYVWRSWRMINRLGDHKLDRTNGGGLDEAEYGPWQGS